MSIGGSWTRSATRDRSNARRSSRGWRGVRTPRFRSGGCGVRPEVVLTLRGSSWLAGTYTGYEEFSDYVLAARQVLESAGKPITYLHDGQEMIVEHLFVVGNAFAEIPLHVKVAFAPDDRIASLLIEPGDQALFDEALDVFLRREAG